MVFAPLGVDCRTCKKEKGALFRVFYMRGKGAGVVPRPLVGAKGFAKSTDDKTHPLNSEENRQSHLQKNRGIVGGRSRKGETKLSSVGERKGELKRYR